MADALVAPDFKDAGLLDTAVVTIRYDNGAIAVAEASFSAAYGYDVRGEVFGSAGMVTAGSPAHLSTAHWSATGVSARPPAPTPTSSPTRMPASSRPSVPPSAGAPRRRSAARTPAPRSGSRSPASRRSRPAAPWPCATLTGLASDAATGTSPFTLAVSAEMVFVGLPFAERVRRIHELGFQVEIWDWTRHDIDALEALREEGVVYSSMTGYVRGRLSDAEGADELLSTAAESVPVAKRLGIPRLNLHGTGLDDRGLPVRPEPVTTGAMWLTAQRTLGCIAELGAREGVMFVLENLNTAVDHPGVPFATAADCLSLVAAVDSPHLKLMLDLYHAQIGEGNLIELLSSGAAPHRGDPGRRRARAS